MTDPKHWDKKAVESALKTLGQQFTIPDERFKWTELGDDGQWDTDVQDENEEIPMLG